MIRLRIKKRRKAEKLMIQYPRKLKFSQNVAGLYGWNGGRGGECVERKRREVGNFWEFDCSTNNWRASWSHLRYILLFCEIFRARNRYEREWKRERKKMFENLISLVKIFSPLAFLGFVPFLSFCISIFILIHEANSSFPFCLFFPPSFFQ